MGKDALALSHAAGPVGVILITSWRTVFYENTVLDHPMNSNSSHTNTLQLILGTGAFALCFAVFGSVSAMMPVLKKQFQLAPVQVSIAMAIPVLLGSLGRIPLGLLADRLGGRKVFTWTMIFSVGAALLMGKVESYSQLLIFGFFTGVALASFSVGVAFVSGWYPPEKQGFALGVYGAGNVGQSLAAFGAPLLFGLVGFRNTFWSFAGLLAVWAVIFFLFAKDAPRNAPPKSFGQMVRPLSEKMSWVLSFFYFLTFGGFVAMSIYLPMFLTDLFKLTPQDAGFRTAGFVLLATAMRPMGGWLADKIGGLTILLWIFPFVSAMALLLDLPNNGSVYRRCSGNGCCDRPGKWRRVTYKERPNLPSMKLIGKMIVRFMVPVRLANVEVPHSLSVGTQLICFKDDGYQKLQRALIVHSRSLGISKY
jgi:NNP family nitrate/nitrite transporter-like MFS transporter